VSIQAMAWVLEEERTTSKAERLVLLSLANHAGWRNGRWECYPSRELVMSEANISLRTYHESLRQLEARGLVVRSINAAPDERIPKDRRPNLFVLNLGDGVAKTATALSTGVAINDERGSKKARDGVAEIATQTVSEPSREPSRAPDPFAEFWDAYPRKVGKPTARAKYARALKGGARPELILAGVHTWKRRWKAEGTLEQYIPHPSTWLHQERWNDSPGSPGPPVTRAEEACSACGVYYRFLVECSSGRPECPVNFTPHPGENLAERTPDRVESGRGQRGHASPAPGDSPPGEPLARPGVARGPRRDSGRATG
jgi:hypothetical protein